jgi:hypothetical protein
MARVDRTTIVHAPIAAVWALAGDPLRWPEWQPSISRAEAVGASHYRLFGGERRTFAYEIVFTERVEPTRVAWEYGRGIRGGGSYALREVEGGTEVHMVESLRLNMLPPARWVIDWMFFNRSYNRGARVALDELQRVAEGRGE